MGKDCNYPLPLFETREARGRIVYPLYVVSVITGLCFIYGYRVTHLPAQGEAGRWAWIGLFMAELWFTIYWFTTQSLRWNPISRYTFKDRLSQRYEKVLPKVDIFVCTADHTVEPPVMVINTVLSVMAYNYPPEKLSVYLSDDGGSELTFYALLEASHFSRLWLPFCKKFKVEPRSPAAYFSTVGKPFDDVFAGEEWLSIKKLYEDMKERINSATELGRLPEELRKEHKGFREWDLPSSRRDHHTFLQILIDGKDSTAVDAKGQALPTLVYLAREKRPRFHHNFKAGAMNSLLRVSSGISNGPIILNVDCDMYSNNSNSLRDALCFLLDEEKGYRIAFVQFPQRFNNITKNDVYNNALTTFYDVEMPGMDGNGGPPYLGTGCFHRREALCGEKYDKETKFDWRIENDSKLEESALVLEQTCRVLASCTYEENTQWGKEMGLKYGCSVEDVITGLSIHCKGWKSVYFNPERKGFIGVAPTTLSQVLVQNKRWAEGELQIFLSKYCPLIYGYGKIPLKHQISYCWFLLWAPNSLATLYYIAVPSLCIRIDISMFPKLSSPWILPFVCVILASYGYSLCEFIWTKGTIQQWWNEQRMWLFKRETSYLFALIDNILRPLGFAELGFIITAKVADEDVSLRYEKEVLEFGAPSTMFNILATMALLNLFSFVCALKMVILETQTRVLDQLALQILLCGSMVLINLPVYQGLFLRKDKGSMPITTMCQSVFMAIFAHVIALY